MSEIISFHEATEKKIQQGLAKGYSKAPSFYTFEFLLHRLREELNEFEWELLFTDKKGDWRTKIVLEFADVINFVFFLRKKINREIRGEE